MHRRSLRVPAILLACALPLLAAAPAGAGQEPPAEGHAVGHAGSAFGLSRVLAGTIPVDSLAAEIDEDVLATDNGIGLTSARANSTSRATFERAMAQAAPHGAAAEGAPTIPRPVPGTVLQTALEDNEEPRTDEVEQTDPPPAVLASVGDMDASVHARWSDTDGPCVDPIADVELSATELALGAAVFTVPDVAVDELDLPLAEGYEPEGALGTLGGLLTGIDAEGEADGTLVSVPDGLSSRSRVTLTELDDAEGEAVSSATVVEASALSVLAGTPMAIDIEVARAPRLEVTSTGDAATSEVDYRVAELEGTLDGETLFELDADERSVDVPIGVPTEEFAELDVAEELAGLPIVGGVGASTDGDVLPLPEEADDHILDLFVLRLSTAGLDERSGAEEHPFPGYRLGASARLLEVQLLPTEALAEALAELDVEPPSALAQFTVGEQVASAYTPTGGVVCGPTDPAAVPDQPAAELSGSAYATRPIALAGAAVLLAGVALVVMATARRGARPKPVPYPRDEEG
ncbi:hypothetical protein [Haloechinothrix sp. LS1_15]|uniref:hypothetical protein n=1 Tax=Haloechinothrix sp. LS1_15 TaxID=2652248 RepID=UPI0029465E86|nr:hypothetical protein [Haloechinothrix sp. LS1_15]MDV6011375.1 hypothetical protein [Haloechinothrix sp. LS1_15]